MLNKLKIWLYVNMKLLVTWLLTNNMQLMPLLVPKLLLILKLYGMKLLLNMLLQYKTLPISNNGLLKVPLQELNKPKIMLLIKLDYKKHLMPQMKLLLLLPLFTNPQPHLYNSHQNQKPPLINFKNYLPILKDQNSTNQLLNLLYKLPLETCNLMLLKILQIYYKNLELKCKMKKIKLPPLKIQELLNGPLSFKNLPLNLIMPLI